MTLTFTINLLLKWIKGFGAVFLVFLILTVVLRLSLTYLRNKNKINIRRSNLLPGQVAYVTQEIKPYQMGRITFEKDDMKILCKARSDIAIPKGTAVVIVKSQNSETWVKPLSTRSNQ